MKSDKIRNDLRDKLDKSPFCLSFLADVCNLIEAIAYERLPVDVRDMSRSKDRDNERLLTQLQVVSLLEGLVDPKTRKDRFNGLRRGEG